MKRITASDARKNWFRVLDEVVAGEVFVVERKGRRVILRCEELERASQEDPTPDYSALLRAADVDSADRWGWAWAGPDREVTSVTVDDE
jgi:hypothetical protein